MSEHEHVYDFFGLDWPRAVDEDFDALPPVITLECACGRFLSEQEIIRRVNAYEGLVRLGRRLLDHCQDGPGYDEYAAEIETEYASIDGAGKFCAEATG